MQMKIAEVKLDGKGRLQIPNVFLKANNIPSNSKVSIRAKYNSNNEIILKFNIPSKRK